MTEHQLQKGVDMKMIKTEKYGPHQIVSYADGIDLVYRMGRITTYYTQRENRYYREEESNNVRNMGNVRRRISRKEFEEVYHSIIECGDKKC